MKNYLAVVCCFDLNPPENIDETFQEAAGRLLDHESKRVFVSQVSSNVFHRVVLQLNVEDGQNPESILSQALAKLELGPVKGIPYTLEELVPEQV